MHIQNDMQLCINMSTNWPWLYSILGQKMNAPLFVGVCEGFKCLQIPNCQTKTSKTRGPGAARSLNPIGKKMVAMTKWAEEPWVFPLKSRRFHLLRWEFAAWKKFTSLGKSRLVGCKKPIWWMGSVVTCWLILEAYSKVGPQMWESRGLLGLICGRVFLPRSFDWQNNRF